MVPLKLNYTFHSDSRPKCELLMETLTSNVFSNKDITVTFEPKLCIHAEKCAKGLSDVFRTDILPWINLDAAKSKKIIKQIRKCPSGALQYCQNDD